MRHVRMGPLSRRFIGCVALLIALTAGSSASPADTDSLNAAIATINQYRDDHGRKTVTVDDRLVEAAKSHARAMADRDFFSHIGADGSTIGQRATRAGYVWALVAENIAAGMSDADAAVISWIDSPGHRQNLLLKGAAHIGMARIRVDPDPGSVTFKEYWVLLLAAPQ